MEEISVAPSASPTGSIRSENSHLPSRNGLRIVFLATRLVDFSEVQPGLVLRVLTSLQKLFFPLAGQNSHDGNPDLRPGDMQRSSQVQDTHNHGDSRMSRASSKTLLQPLLNVSVIRHWALVVAPGPDPVEGKVFELERSYGIELSTKTRLADQPGRWSFERKGYTTFDDASIEALANELIAQLSTYNLLYKNCQELVLKLLRCIQTPRGAVNLFLDVDELPHKYGLAIVKHRCDDWAAISSALDHNDIIDPYQLPMLPTVADFIRSMVTSVIPWHLGDLMHPPGAIDTALRSILDRVASASGVSPGYPMGSVLLYYTAMFFAWWFPEWRTAFLKLFWQAFSTLTVAAMPIAQPHLYAAAATLGDHLMLALLTMGSWSILAREGNTPEVWTVTFVVVCAGAHATFARITHRLALLAFVLGTRKYFPTLLEAKTWRTYCIDMFVGSVTGIFCAYESEIHTVVTAVGRNSDPQSRHQACTALARRISKMPFEDLDGSGIGKELKRINMVHYEPYDRQIPGTHLSLSCPGTIPLTVRKDVL